MWREQEVLSTEDEEEPDELFHRYLQKATNISQQWGKAKAKLRKQKETELRGKLSTAQILLEIDP